jgi:hypothetical protein
LLIGVSLQRNCSNDFDLSEGGFREQSGSIRVGAGGRGFLGWVDAGTNKTYAYVGGVTKFENDRRRAHISGRAIYRISSTRNRLEGERVCAADLAGERG